MSNRIIKCPSDVVKEKSRIFGVELETEGGGE